MQRSDPGFEARNLALSILIKVEREEGYANLILPSELRKSTLEPRDSAFATELVYGTLRKQIMYDVFIERAATRKISKIDIVPRNILRLTAHQLLSLKTPAHAAVDSAVRLTVRNKNGSASGFVNAIARRLSERSLDEWLEIVGSGLSDVERSALESAHPVWIVQSYLERLGDFEKVKRELHANNLNPEVTGVIYPGNTWSAPTVAASIECEWSDQCRYLHGNPELIPEIKHATAGIQDQGSYLVARALAMVPTESEGKADTWVDLCAGPGGKAALLDRWAQEQGRAFVALEFSEHRAALIQRVTRSIVVADSRKPPIRSAAIEKVLLDAPCSGLGALRRRPDARLKKNPEQIENLVTLQRELLSAAHEVVQPGGVIGYVTCSPVYEETAGNRKWFLENHHDMELMDAKPFFPAELANTLGDSLDVQLWPGAHNTDAMYLAIFKKKPIER